MSFDNSTTVNAADVQGQFGNNVTIIGTVIETSDTGTRVVLGSDDPTHPEWKDQILMYTGHADSPDPAEFQVSGNTEFAQLLISSPPVTGSAHTPSLNLFTDQGALPSPNNGVDAYAYQFIAEDPRGGQVVMEGGGITTDGNVSVGGTLATAGDVTVGGKLNAPGTVYSVAYSGTTDASGFLTVSHAAGFTPAAGWAMTTNPNSSFAQPYGIDSLTATSARLRFANVAGTGAAASTAVAGRLFLLHP
jgi:hypothetical protein